ncbi:redoxin domain-containing protein [Winogradskyella sp. PE311]|uniref:redoxin domain-containing protein n=1 Tax=Winogradskyella sp. PE311 TaxID=3366943 RepID=UPI00398134F5
MKKVLTLLILSLLIVSCEQEKRTDYLINGNAEGVYNGIRVYLKSVDEKGQETAIDTAIVMDEKFEMQGVVSEPNIYFLSVDGAQGKAIFMLENSEITVKVDKENLAATEVTGSESNDDFLAFQDGTKKIRDEGTKIMRLYQELNLQEGSAQSDSLTNELNKLREELTSYPLNFIKDNNDSYFSLELMKVESNKPKGDISIFNEVFNNLTPRLKESTKGQKIKERLIELEKEFEKIAHLEVGKIAPDFESPTPDGDMVRLNDIKGKVTIIDFWAAWCGPCRRENPNVVRIYEKYHEKGLEIIGVSLDGQSRQQNPKKAWLDAIDADKLTWHHVSSLKYFRDPVAELYNIQAIPATFILDSKGTIVAKNLRGNALEDKIKELLE